MKRDLTILLIITFVAVLSASCGGSYSQEITETYPNGATKTIQYFRERDGIKSLYKIEEFHDNGIKRIEGYMKNDKRNGRWNSWHSNGRLWSVANYLDGNLDGKQTVYHPSGEKFYEGEFGKGIRKGTWLFYDEKGVLVNKRQY